MCDIFYMQNYFEYKCKRYEIKAFTRLKYLFMECWN